MSIRSCSSSSFFTAFEFCSNSISSDSASKSTHEIDTATEVPSSTCGDSTASTAQNYTRNECETPIATTTFSQQNSQSNNRIILHPEWDDFLTPRKVVKLKKSPPVSSSRNMLRDPMKTFLDLHVQTVLDLFNRDSD